MILALVIICSLAKARLFDLYGVFVCETDEKEKLFPTDACGCSLDRNYRKDLTFADKNSPLMPVDIVWTVSMGNSSYLLMKIPH